jgi:hypothetical protein
MKVTACECVEPGWCPRHRCVKNELHFQLCRRRPDYFQAWEEGRGPGQDGPRSGFRPDPCETADRQYSANPLPASLDARRLSSFRKSLPKMGLKQVEELPPRFWRLRSPEGGRYVFAVSQGQFHATRAGAG